MGQGPWIINDIKRGVHIDKPHLPYKNITMTVDGLFQHARYSGKPCVCDLRGTKAKLTPEGRI